MAEVKPLDWKMNERRMYGQLVIPHLTAAWLAKLRKRLRSLPRDVQIAVAEDIRDTVENRLETMERIAG